MGTLLVVQWLKLYSQGQRCSSISGLGTEILNASGRGQKKRERDLHVLQSACNLNIKMLARAVSHELGVSWV